MNQPARAKPSVLHGSQIIYSILDDGGRFQVRRENIDISSIASTLECLFNSSEHNNIRRVWITPGDRFNAVQPETIPTKAGKWTVREFHQEQGTGKRRRIYMTTITGKYQQTGKRTVFVTLVFTENSLYSFDTKNAITLLGAISYLEMALGRELHHHPGVQGRDLIISSADTPQRRELVKQTDYDFSLLPGVSDGQIAGGNMAYQTGLSETTRYWTNAYLYGKDKNSMYLAACTSTELGVGAPEYYTQEDIYNKFVFNGKKLPVAFWHLEINVSSLPDPCPLAANQTWVTTDLLLLLINEQVGFTITEAYIWTKHLHLLDNFATLLWRVRQKLKKDRDRYPHEEAAIIAANCIKDIATVGIGLLASPSTKTNCPQWYLPHWSLTISESAKVRMYIKLKEIEKMYGVKPVAVNTDAFYYIFDKVPTLFPQAFKRGDTELGGWKDMFPPVPVTPAVIECFKPGYTMARAKHELEKLLRGI